MKILVYTDNHYCQYSSIVRGRGDKYSIRIENQIKSLNWVQQIATEEKVDAVYCLGDFFDTPTLNPEELTALPDIQWNKDIKQYFLVGNHEMGINDLTYSSAHLMSMVPNCKIIDKPTMITGFGYRLILLPYILETNRKPLRDYIDELFAETAGMIETQEYKHTYIFSHNDISGIRYGQWESKAGFSVDEITDSCDLYVNGHLHNQQQVNKKIINLGNLTGQNFSEDAFKYSHCVGILDTSTMKLDLINNPYALNFYKFDFTTESNLDVLLKCKNGVITAKVFESKVQEVKAFIEERCDIIEYRIISVAERKEQNAADKVEIVAVNHIDKFKEYLLENMENTDVLLEELNNL